MGFGFQRVSSALFKRIYIQRCLAFTASVSHSLCDLQAGVEKSMLQGPGGQVGCLILSSDNKTLFSGGGREDFSIM